MSPTVTARSVDGRGAGGQYCRVRVVINDGERELEVEKEQPLLFALMRERIFIPSACGGRASCGQCRVRVLSGAPGHVEEERRILGPDEMGRGMRLACQLRVRQEVRIELPRGYLDARPYRGTVSRISEPALDMREIEIDLVDPPAMTFLAGQYVQFVVPGTENDPQPLYRAYSMASPPSRPNRLALLFARVPDGACTSFVFGKLKLGDAVTVNGPFGSFYVREGQRPVVIVAGGSGIAPVRAMLMDMSERRVSRSAVFFFSAHSRADLVYTDDLRALQRRLPSLRYVPVLSRPLPEDRWDGERGGLPSVLARLLPPLDEYEAYLCGGPGLIDASISAMRSKGLRAERTFYDKFS
jgi:Na+-transporting NADH:ubiquinone oxidoreductase subunit F